VEDTINNINRKYINHNNIINKSAITKHNSNPNLTSFSRPTISSSIKSRAYSQIRSTNNNNLIHNSQSLISLKDIDNNNSYNNCLDNINLSCLSPRFVSSDTSFLKKKNINGSLNNKYSSNNDNRKNSIP